MERELLVRMRQICKNFGAVKALDKVDFELYSNEIVGLVGDNGAGKSTLVKILLGAISPDGGELFFQDKKINIGSPREARALGIEGMYQDLALHEKIDIADNIFMGRELTKNFLGGMVKILDRRKMREESRKILRSEDIEISSVKAKIMELSGGQRKAVAIARAIYWEGKIIILDEPTAALGVKELNKVLGLIKKLKEHGDAVIFISHNLQEIFSTVDRIVILRSGKLAGVRNVRDSTPEEIIKLMVGKMS